MSALSTDKEQAFKERHYARVPMAAVKIWKGGMVKINAAGFAAPCAAEAGAVFLGIALETTDNSAGNAGDLYILLETQADIIFEQQTGFVAADAGSKVYASTDADISVSQASNEQQVGWIVEFISATSVRVRLSNGL